MIAPDALAARLETIGGTLALDLAERLRAGDPKAPRLVALIARWREGRDNQARAWRRLAIDLGEEPVYPEPGDKPLGLAA